MTLTCSSGTMGKKGARSTSKAKPTAKEAGHLANPPPLTVSLHNTQKFTVDNTSGHCTTIDDGELCECEEYSEDINSHTGKVKCRECGHGRSKHKGAQRGKKVRSIVEDLVVKKFGAPDKISTFNGAENEANKGFRPKSKTTTKTVLQPLLSTIPIFDKVLLQVSKVVESPDYMCGVAAVVCIPQGLMVRHQQRLLYLPIWELFSLLLLVD
jgi:hypothetical protein